MHPLLEGYFKVIKRFIPDRPVGTSVGIDIGTKECKLVELTKTEGGYEVLNWLIQPIENGDISAALTTCVSILDKPCTHLFTSVYGRGTLIRYIEMPQMNLHDLKNSFAIEADKYFPFAQDEIYTDCYILEEKKNKKMSVMVAAAKKEIVDARVEVLKTAGLPIHYIGMDTIALANALSVLENSSSEGEEAAKKADDKVLALVDMGSSVCSLTILLNGKPCFARDIFIGGKDFVKQMAVSLGQNEEEAEKIINEQGSSTAGLLDHCQSALNNIVQELRLSFDYFSTENNREIDKLYITGGLSLLNGIDSTLQQNLETEVEVLNFFSKTTIAEGIEKEQLHANSSKLSVALGLALYGYDTN